MHKNMWFEIGTEIFNIINYKLSAIIQCELKNDTTYKESWNPQISTLYRLDIILR